MGDFTYIYTYFSVYFFILSIYITHLQATYTWTSLTYVTLTGHRGLHRGQQALRVPVLGCRLGGAVAGLEDVGGVFW